MAEPLKKKCRWEEEDEAAGVFRACSRASAESVGPALLVVCPSMSQSAWTSSLLSCASVMFQIGDDEDEMEGLAGPGTGASGEEPGGQESVQSAAEVAVALASTVCPQARMFICRASSV